MDCWPTHRRTLTRRAPQAHIFSALLLVLTAAIGSGERLWAAELLEPQRLDEGYVIVVPGILGHCPWDHHLAHQLTEARVPAAVEVYDWTAGPVLLAYNALSARRKQREAGRIAARVAWYQHEYPGRPVYLVGHSGGASLVVQALEALPAENHVSRAILLAPGLPCDYDLSPAIAQTRRGIDSFHSPLDVPIGIVFASCVQAARGRWSTSAGAHGFEVPDHLGPLERRRYAHSLRQHQHSREMLNAGHLGGHFGWTTRGFVHRWLVPLMSGTRVVVTDMHDTPVDRDSVALWTLD